MKSSYLRAGFALLCAAILSACGGNNGNLTLSGGISYSGPAKPGLVLINNSNGEKLPIDTGVSTIIFTKMLATDETFDVEILTQPTGAKCDIVSGNKGRANYYTVSSLLVSCVATPFTLGGTIKGLTGSGLVLANGADTVAVAAPATAGADVAFTFPAQVPNGALYGGTVLTQPAGQTCAFASTLNPGTMPFADQKGLIVNCTNN